MLGTELERHDRLLDRPVGPTLYHYFRNKEELLVLVYSDVLEQSLRMARETVAAAPNPRDALHGLLDSRVVHTCANRAALKICFEEEGELPPDLTEELLVRRRAFEKVVSDQVRAHLAAHPEVDPGMSPTVFTQPLPRRGELDLQVVPARRPAR